MKDGEPQILVLVDLIAPEMDHQDFHQEAVDPVEFFGDGPRVAVGDRATQLGRRPPGVFGGVNEPTVTSLARLPVWPTPRHIYGFSGSGRGGRSDGVRHA